MASVSSTLELGYAVVAPAVALLPEWHTVGAWAAPMQVQLRQLSWETWEQMQARRVARRGLETRGGERGDFEGRMDRKSVARRVDVGLGLERQNC